MAYGLQHNEDAGCRLRLLFVGQLRSNEVTLLPVQLRRLPLVMPRRATVMGALARAIIQRLLFEKRAALMQCLELRSSLGPLPGTYSAMVELVIGPDGRVNRASPTSSSPIDHGLAGCLVGWLEKLTFPGCGCGGLVIVRHPFDIHPP